LVAGTPTTSPLSRKPPCSGEAGWRGVSPSLDALTDRARRRMTVNLRDAKMTTDRGDCGSIATVLAEGG